MDGMTVFSLCSLPSLCLLQSGRPKSTSTTRVVCFREFVHTVDEHDVTPRQKVVLADLEETLAMRNVVRSKDINRSQYRSTVTRIKESNAVRQPQWSLTNGRARDQKTWHQFPCAIDRSNIDSRIQKHKARLQACSRHHNVKPRIRRPTPCIHHIMAQALVLNVNIQAHLILYRRFSLSYHITSSSCADQNSEVPFGS
jgi:hypothetical protein